MKRSTLGSAVAALLLFNPLAAIGQDAPSKPSILVAPFLGVNTASNTFGYDVASRLESLLMVDDDYTVISIERLHSLLPTGIAAQYPDRRQASDASSSCIRSRQAASVAAVRFVLCANVREVPAGYEVSATLYTARDSTERSLSPVQARDPESVGAQLLIQLRLPERR